MTPDSALHQILSNPKLWLWTAEVQVELYSVLPLLWVKATDDAREALICEILRGPPRELFHKNLDKKRLELLCDRSIWELLIRIASTAVPLPTEAQTTLDRLRDNYSDWVYTGQDREDFPVWTGSDDLVAGEQRGVDLSQLQLDQLTAMLRQSRLSSEQVNGWVDLASRHPERFVDALECVAYTRVDRAIWATALGIEGIKEPARSAAERILRLLTQVSDAILVDVTDRAVDFLRNHATRTHKDARNLVFVAWDRLFAIVSAQPVIVRADRLTQALNHPMGRLAEILVHLLHSEDTKDARAIPVELRTRLELVLDRSRESGRPGRVIVASRLAILHSMDRDWTVLHLLPLFDWRDEIEAQGAWQGFLWSPFVQPSLWVNLKPMFLSIFAHAKGFESSFERRLASMLASLAIDGDKLLSIDEIRHCLRSLSNEGRETVAWFAWRRLNDAGDRSPLLWQQRIGPWIAKAWPREKEFQSGGVSGRLAEAAASTGSAFPEAVPTILTILVPVRWPAGLFDQLRTTGLARKYPGAALALLSTLLEENTFIHGDSFSHLLDDIRDAAPELANDKRLRRLNEFATRATL
jgi:hypothetical protein